jgi:hypothetical protein
MQGTIAQVVALTTHGNAILQDFLNSRELDFQAQNSTFKFCEWIRFTDAISGASNLEERLYATDVHGWFAGLRKEGMRGVRMSYTPSGTSTIPDRTLAGFVGGGGKWLIETYQHDLKYHWEPRWKVGDRERRDKRIWHVVYARVLSSKVSGWSQTENLAELKLELRQALVGITRFARSQELGEFASAFESGIAKLDSRTPFEGLYYDDIAPVDFLSLNACQLLAAADVAWVFGAMGSWNDVYFDKNEKGNYDNLSEKLYQLLNRAIVAAANSQALSS